MSRRIAVLAASVALISGVATPATAADPASCASLASLHLPDTTITLAAPVTDGPLPPYCRVVGVIRPTADSQIGFETWLPLQNWNGKVKGCRWTGCRKGLMEAQPFPHDYDGLVVGAPANFWTHVLAGGAAAYQARLKDPESYFPAAKLPLLEAAVNAKCDLKDGIADGVLN